MKGIDIIKTKIECLRISYAPESGQWCVVTEDLNFPSSHAAFLGTRAGRMLIRMNEFISHSHS